MHSKKLAHPLSFLLTLSLFVVSVFAFGSTASAQSKTEFLNLPKDVVMNYGDEYTYNIDYRFVGNDSGMKAVLNVAKNTHGFELLGPYYKGNNIFTIQLAGRARALGSQKFTITVNNGKTKILTGDISINVVGLEFATTTFPTVYGVGKQQSLKIPYKYSGKQLIRFSYNLPTSFQYHEQDSQKNTGSMEFKFTPYKTGTYKIDVTATGDNPFGTGSLVMSKKTFTLIIKNENEKPAPIVLGVATTTKATTTKATTTTAVVKKPVTVKKVAPKKVVAKTLPKKATN